MYFFHVRRMLLRRSTTQKTLKYNTIIKNQSFIQSRNSRALRLFNSKFHSTVR